MFGLFRWVRVAYNNTPIAAYFARRRWKPSPRRLAIQKDAAGRRSSLAKWGVGLDRMYGEFSEYMPDQVAGYQANKQPRVRPYSERKSKRKMEYVNETEASTV